MTWTGTQGSAIFQQSMLNPIAGRCWTTAAPTTFSSLSADVINVALFGNTGTPNKADLVTNIGYGVGQWVSGNETNGGANWPAGGLPLASKTFAIDATSSSICFGGANLASTGNVTVTNAYGCLVYDNTITGGTVAKQGLCFNYFGGAQSVTTGTFTVIWAVVTSTSTVFNITV
jgi:hypothetical protein